MASMKRAVISKCHSCSAGYQDGKQDCEVVGCPLYAYMPYAKLKPDLSWQKYNPKRVGFTTEKISRKPMTEERKRQLVAAMAKARKGKASR